jgi:hypothetical protein
VVLPWSTWAMMATLRRSVRVCIHLLSPVSVAGGPRGRSTGPVPDVELFVRIRGTAMPG